MSITYTPTTNFGAKDSLPANDPAKVIKGADFSTEYTAIQSAFSLAAPASNPTFTGTATFANTTVTGTATFANATVTGDLTATLTTAAQPNITSVGKLTGFESTGIDDNATATAITIDASENVGIGGAPTYNSDSLQVSGAGSFYGNATQVLRIVSSSDTGSSEIRFGDPANAAIGQYKFDHSDNSHSWVVDGAERMRLVNGNVGIGTTSPSTKLHVTQTADDSSDGIRLSRSNSLATYTQWVDADSRYNFGYANPATADPATPALTLTTVGRVGIGTPTPNNTALLHLQANATNGISGSGLLRLQNAVTNSTTISFDNPTNDWSCGTNGDANWNVYDVAGNGTPLLIEAGAPSGTLRVKSTGRIGIGETNPARKLHVSDAMRLEPIASAPTSPAAGDLYFDSTLNKLRCYDGTTWQNCF